MCGLETPNPPDQKNTALPEPTATQPQASQNTHLRISQWEHVLLLAHKILSVSLSKDIVMIIFYSYRAQQNENAQALAMWR